MNSRKSKRTSQTIKISIACIVAFALGYYALNYISTRERPYLGNTIYIIGGCAAMAISLLVLGITLKKHFFPKRKKSSRHTYLDENKNTISKRID